MTNEGTSVTGVDLRAVLERELERRRGHAPEPGEIFVLPETAELPVEWALLEARGERFLAVPADVQPLAGSRDLALGADVLSGPLVLRCGHGAEIAASHLRPELRTGLLDPQSLATARELQANLAAGTAAEDPLGEEVDRDPEYRDWVEEVLDPARAGVVGLGERGAEVVNLEDRRERRSRPGAGSQNANLLQRSSPWLAAALLAVSLGLGWQLQKSRSIVIDPQSEQISLGTTVRGDRVVKLASGADSLLLSIAMSVDVPTVENAHLRFSRLGGERLFEGEPRKVGPGSEVAVLIPRERISAGRYSLELIGEGGEPLASEDIRIEVP